jgi:hypothetical protein
MCCSVLLLLGATVGRFEARPTAAADSASAHGAAVVGPAVTFTIPLATLDDVRRLDQRPEIAEIIHTALAYSDSPIFLAGYVTADDVLSNRADAESVADELVIEIGGYLANRGVEADRISGKGMGIDPAIGRAVVVLFGITAPPAELVPPRLRATASRESAGWRSRREARLNSTTGADGGTTVCEKLPI